MSREAGVYTDQELRAILQFYHSCGKITYYGDRSLLGERSPVVSLGGQHGGSPVLRDTVIFSSTAFSKIVYRLTARMYFNNRVSALTSSLL